jgi:16S rRNA (guanine527-N7)-methyltransferase
MLYLKGGDLQAEVDPVREKVRMHSLSDHFKEEFFATKRVVEVAM